MLFNRKAVLVNIASRAVRMSGNLILIILVGLFFDDVMRGFYYTFLSLIVLQFFAELGLGATVIQTISHASSSMHKQALICFYLRWYIVVSIILFVFLLPIIYIFNSEIILIDNYAINIIVPWFLLSLFTGSNLMVNGCLSILEGLGKIEIISRIKVLQTIAGVSGSIFTIIVGGQLYSLVVGSFITMLMGVKLLVNQRHLMLSGNLTKEIEYKIEWKKTILPFQWRVGMSWISGFFTFYFFTPIIMKFLGPISAGQIGMTLQLMQAINSISNIWVSTGFPIYGRLVSEGKIKKMEKMFFTNAAYSLMSFVFLILMLILILYFIDNSEFRSRLLPDDELIYVLIAGAANQIFFIFNYYLRSYKEEPFWFISVVNAIATLVLTIYYIPLYGTIGAVIIYAVMSSVFWVFIGAGVFLRKRNLLINKI